MLVNFVIAGTQKGGTTALWSYLRGHRDISMSRIKETHFFDSDNYCADFDLYHRFFTPGKVVGEATPIYMYLRDVPARIFEYNPGMKFIILLRCPVERAFSHWMMERVRGTETLSFREAILRVGVEQHRVFSYVDRGRYREQLDRIHRCFPKEQVLVLKSWALMFSPQKTLDTVCDFLGVDRFDVCPRTVFSQQYNTPMDHMCRSYLECELADDIAFFEAL